MVIKFFYGAKKGAFASAIMAKALISGKALRINHPFVSIEVDEWHDFLRIVSSACAECSRDGRGQLMSVRMPISVTYKGTEYHTQIWYDNDARGIRYVSLL